MVFNPTLAMIALLMPPNNEYSLVDRALYLITIIGKGIMLRQKNN